jgi:1-deoxy-D-xylulose-5-phosphate synthase
LDVALLLEVAASHEALVTVEEGCLMGGAGSAVSEALQQAGVLKPLLQLGLQDNFTEHGDPAVLLAMQGLDAVGIEASINTRFSTLVQSRAAKVALKSVA